MLHVSCCTFDLHRFHNPDLGLPFSWAVFQAAFPGTVWQKVPRARRGHEKERLENVTLSPRVQLFDLENVALSPRVQLFDLQMTNYDDC